MASPSGVVAGSLLRGALWLLLGGWVGAWLLFGLVVAPAAFRVLPSTEVAGALIGPVLTALHLYGGAAGLALAALARALDRPAWLVALPIAMSATCLASHFGVTAAIAEIRDLAFGPGGSEEVAARFRALHRLSVGLFIAVGVAALALAALHAWADARESGGRVPAG
jgi:hypothetical protein